MFQHRSPRSLHKHYERILEALGGAITSRRDLLLGAAVGAGSMPIVGHAARAARNFKVQADDCSLSLLVGDVPAWHIDARWFDGRPKLQVRSGPDRLRVHLTQAFFPGTDLPADLELDANRRGHQWDAEFAMRALQWRASGCFDRWLLGLEEWVSPFGFDSLRLKGRSAPAFEELRGVARFAPDWAFVASAVQAGTCSFAAAASRVTNFRLELDHAPTEPPRTSVWTEQTGVHDALCGDEAASCSVRVDGVHSLFAVAGRDGTDMVVQDGERASRLIVHGRRQVDIPAHDVEILHRFDGAAHAWNARLSTDAGVWIPFEGGALQLVQDDEAPVRLASANAISPFDRQCPPEPAAFVVPVAGADDAIFQRRRSAGDCAITQFSGHSIDLAPFDLHLRRGADGLACVVRFRNVVLEHALRGWSLKGVPGHAAQIEFDLGSQHLREEAVYFTNWCDGSAPPKLSDEVLPVPDEQAVERLKNWPAGKPLPLGITSLPPNTTRYADYLAKLKATSGAAYEKFRVDLANEQQKKDIPPACSTGLPPPRFERAGATHLLFDLEDGRSIPLGLEALFAWGRSSPSPLKAVFSQRAAPEGTMSIGALDMVISDPRSIADAPTSGPPEGNVALEYATRIEAPAQLVVSPVPDKLLRWPSWSVSAKPQQEEIEAESVSEVWNIRMTDVGVRAIYSPKATAPGGVFKPFSGPPPYPGSALDAFRASYDARDLHELVGLTGAYNYRALCGSAQVTCKGEPPDTPEEGHYLSAPMKAELLLLSGLGASFRYRGAWSPPATVDSSGALSLKRYEHNASLGRDSYVRLEYKGYLFPLGVPAVLIKLTDRRFGFEGGKRWVARLVQRFFIYVPGFTRSFPAVGQPHERMWGHAQTTMQAHTTPDLDDPAKYEVVKGMGITAFWPCLPGGDAQKSPNDVVFEFGDPLTNARYAAPLVFIDNSVAHDKDKLSRVISSWRAGVNSQLGVKREAWPAADRAARYFATVASGKLPYIAGQRGDNTVLETSRILLGVSLPGEDGYDDSVDENHIKNTVTFTSRMESRDQPPFYPVRRRALVNSTAAAVLSGQSRQEHLLDYDPVFLDAALDVKRNAATVFGVFVEPGLHLDFGQDTSRSGAAFSPSAVMVHASLKRGLLGGRAEDLRKLGELSHVPPHVAPVAAGPLLAPLSSPATVAKAAVAESKESRPDDFDPKRYFGLVLGDAKLLGVVRLVDILDVLLEATGTRIPTIERQDLYDVVLPVLRAAADAAVFAAGQVEDVLHSMMSGDSKPGQATPDEIAARRLEPLWKDVQRAAAAAHALLDQSAPAEAAVADAASVLGASLDKFKTALESIASDPTVLLPTDARELITDARGFLDLLHEFAPPDRFASAVAAQLETLAIAQLRQRIETIVMSLAGNPQVARITSVLRTASEAMGRLQEGAKGGRELLRMLQPEAIAQLTGTLGAAETQLLGITSLASDACRTSDFVLWAQGAVRRSAASWGRLDAEVAALVHELAAGFEKGVTESRSTDPAVQAVVLNAQHSCISVLSALNADADALAQAATHVAALNNIDLCDHSAPGELHDAARALFAYLLSAPARVQRAAALLQHVDKDAPKLFAKFAIPWAKAEKFAVDRCVQTLNAANAPALVPAIAEAREGAVAISRTLASALASIGEGAQLNAIRASLATAQDVTHSYDILRAYVEAVATLSPSVIAAAGRRELQMAIDGAVRRIAVVRAGVQDSVFRAALAEIPAVTFMSLAKAARDVGGAKRYLSQDLKEALDAFSAAAAKCANIPVGQGAQTAEVFVAGANALYGTLGRAIASGDPSKLADLHRVAQDVASHLGVPTRVRIHYQWNSKVHEFPSGEGAIFEPRGDGMLNISSTVEGGLDGGTPTVSLAANLSAFTINLFGTSAASNFLSIGFNGLVIAAQPGQALDCTTDITEITPGEALGFVKRLSAVFGGRSGFFVLPSTRGIVVGYEYARPIETLGGFTIQNLALQITATLPFDNSPVLARFALASKEKPFLMSAGIYGGGGFVGIRTRADTLEILEASFEYGAVAAFAYGPIAGSGRITAGIYIRMGGRSPLIQGFFCAAGEASIVGLISVSAMLRVDLTYHPDTGQTSGAADFIFRFSIGFLHYAYTCTVPYAKSGDSAGGNQAALGGRDGERTLLAYAASSDDAIASDGPSAWGALFGRDPHAESFVPNPGLLSQTAWRNYWRTFEPHARPAASRWMASWQGHTRDESREGKAPQPATRDSASWYVVPWGFEKNPATTLRASLRIMLSGTDHAMRTQWPQVIASGGNIKLVGSGVARQVDVGAAYRAQLASLGLTVDDAQDLWHAIFSDNPPAASSPNAGRPGVSKESLLTQSDHMHATASVIAGQIFAASLQAAASNPASRMAPLSSFHQNSALADVLSNTASLYVSAQAPQTVRATQTLGQPAQTSTLTEGLNALMMASGPKAATVAREMGRWIGETLLAHAPGAAARPATVGASVLGLGAHRDHEGLLAAPAGAAREPIMRTHFSADAIAVLTSGSVAELAKNAKSTVDRFKLLLLSRMAAYASDPIHVQKEEMPETFEDRLAGLVAHPWLLKALGLVIDIRVDFGLSQTALDRVFVESWGDGHKYSPRFITIVEQGFPRATEPKADAETAAAIPAIKKGLVDLSPGTDRFVLGQLDVDRTPQRILQTAVSFRSELLAGVHEMDMSVALQPQETVGISLHERLHAEPALKPPPGDHELYLRHLLLGIRADVRRVSAEIDAAGAHAQAWTSLSARRVSRISIDGRDVTEQFRGVLHLVDEGFIGKRLRRTDVDEGDIPESEWFRWDVWPLGAPRPDAANADSAELPRHLEGKARRAHKSRLSIVYECLPGATAQRIGEGYRIGARAVMIDGNSISLDDADQRVDELDVREGSRGNDEGAAQREWLGFQRFESVQPPKVLMEGWPQRTPLLPERSARAVVESSGRQVTRRILVPPRCASTELAIRHGVFDTPAAADQAPAGAFAGVLLTPAGEFPSFKFAYEGLSDRSGTQEAYFRRLVSTPPPVVPYYPDPWAQRVILGFYRAGDDQLMYLEFHDYYEGRSWPDARELDLVVRATESVTEPRGFTVQKEDGRLTVTLARGVHLKLRLWHEISRAQLDQCGVVDQIVQFARQPEAADLLTAIGSTGKDAKQIRTDILDWLSNWYTLRADDPLVARPDGHVLRTLNLASLWMINPPQEVELLHACERPVIPAYLSTATLVPSGHGTAHAPAPVSDLERAVAVVREEAKTSVTFKGDVILDRATTRQVDAQAAWADNGTMPVKTANGSFIRVDQRQALLFQLRDIAPVAKDRTGVPTTQPLPSELTAEQRLQALEGMVPASLRNPKERPITSPYDFGDTRARALHVTLTSSARHAAEFVDGDAATVHTVKSRPQRLVVPAARRPDAPQVEYVMPLYKWNSGQANNSRQRLREAGWFRIWLGREWYSSGNGELLALVCWPGQLFDPQDRAARLGIGIDDATRRKMAPKWVEPMVTRWGIDPLAEQDIAFGALPASALRNRIRSLDMMKARVSEGDAAFANDLHHLMDAPTFEPQFDLQRLPDAPASGSNGDKDSIVTLALYRPMFDATTGRWYADIQIKPEYAYKPFVRLALARWQTHALRRDSVDLRLSRIVSTEFVQLLPERSATLVAAAPVQGRRTVRVSLAGPFMAGADKTHSRTEVIFRMERLHPTRTGETWIPLGHSSAKLENGAFSESLIVPDEFGAAYSIVIEERETFHGEESGSGRLVYFDRISIPRWHEGTSR
jgi:hypothetical protein